MHFRRCLDTVFFFQYNKEKLVFYIVKGPFGVHNVIVGHIRSWTSFAASSVFICDLGENFLCLHHKQLRLLLQICLCSLKSISSKISLQVIMIPVLKPVLLHLENIWQGLCVGDINTGNNFLNLKRR